jgi:hypothetical protein
MTTNLQGSIVPRLLRLSAVLLLPALFSTDAAAVQDVMLQTMNGQIETGVVNDVSGVGTLGTRVYGGHFLQVSGDFRTSDPGFYSLRTGDVRMPPGASGFPSQRDVNFDLLPMSVEAVVSNLFYWDGSDANGGGVDLTDVDFVVPTGLYWEVHNFETFEVTTADGSDQLVPGGLIQRTSNDVWPDGVDSGTIHKHLALQVRDDDGNSGTTAPQGVYLISWQARSAGFATSDPFFFVHRTPAISDATRDVAVEWVEANIEMLISPPQLTGDYNGDGSVNAADYVVWRKTLGQSGTDLPADGNGDEQITDEDYTVWRENFGASGSSMGAGSASVPEPGSMALVVAAIILSSALGRQLVHRESGKATSGPFPRNTP